MCVNVYTRVTVLKLRERRNITRRVYAESRTKIIVIDNTLYKKKEDIDRASKHRLKLSRDEIRVLARLSPSDRDSLIHKTTTKTDNHISHCS